MDGLFFTLLASVGVLLAGAVWIWFRNDAPPFKKAEAIFLLSVFIFWIGAMTGLYGPIRIPFRPLEQRYRKTAEAMLIKGARPDRRFSRGGRSA